MKDQFLQVYEEDLRSLAESLREASLPSLSEELFEQYEKTGNRVAYEKVYFERRKMLSVYAICAERYGRQEDVKKLEKILLSICKEKTWALPAHVDRRNHGWENTIDLFAAETAQSLAEIAALAEDGSSKAQLSKDVLERVWREIKKRVLDPFAESEVGAFGWELSTNNWNSVCCGCIGSAALDMGMEELIPRLFESIQNYLKGFGEDGACLEGLHYWTYGFFYFAVFLDKLISHDFKEEGKALARKARALLESEKVRQIAAFGEKCILPGGYSVCFADSMPREKTLMGLAAWIANFYGAENAVTCKGMDMRTFETLAYEMRPYETNGFGLPATERALRLLETDCYRYEMIRWSLLKTEAMINTLSDAEGDFGFSNGNRNTGTGNLSKGPKLKEESGIILQKKTAYIFPNAQWAAYQGKEGSALAIKGGNNGEPHNHNDVGSFQYLYQGEMICADLGRGEYSAAYFGEKRDEILCISSLGHGVPVVDGAGQCSGSEYAANSFEAFEDGRVRISFGNCYSREKGIQLVRNACLDLETGALSLEDEVKTAGQCHVEETFVTLHTVLVREDGRSIQIGNHVVMHAEDGFENIRLEHGTHRDGDGVDQTVTIIRIGYVICGEATLRFQWKSQ